MMQSILIIILFTLSTIFAFLFYIQRKKNIQILNKMLELIIFHETHQDEIKTDKERANEDFLKFVSDSRDLAYTYIDKVQASLNKFISDIEPEIKYFKEYGDIVAMAPNYYSMKKIVEAYEELKTLLPEDYGTIDI